SSGCQPLNECDEMQLRTVRYVVRRGLTSLSSSHRDSRVRNRLLQRHVALNIQAERQFIVGVARHFLKLRYFIATGVIGGSVAARNWYDDWKASLPDFTLPDWANIDAKALWQDLSEQLSHMKKGFGGEGSESKLAEWVARFETFRKDREATLLSLMAAFGVKKDDENKEPSETPDERIQRLQEEMLRTQ
ncbi:hypothetical protein TELCIR_23253, partial [Teladorsagia circumcincta]